jgi:hypothetical protein
MNIRDYIEKDGKHTVYISGFPMLYSWVFSYKNYILSVIGIAADHHRLHVVVLFPHVHWGVGAVVLWGAEFAS